MKPKRLLFLLLLLFLFGDLHSTSPVGLSGQPVLQLYTSAEIANVGEQTWPLSQFLDEESLLNFATVKNANENIGFTSDNFWIRFTLQNNTGQPLTYYLETARPITDRVDLYTIGTDGSRQKLRSGDQIPFSERAFPHRASVFKLQLAPQATYQCYLHLQSDGEVINLPLTLHSPDHFIIAVYGQQLFYGFFYGLIFLAAIIYLFFYLGLQERSFLNYGLYVLSIGLLQLALDGFLFQYLFPEGGWFNSRVVMVFASFSIFFLGRYSETFLNLRDHFKWLSRIFRGIYIFVGIMLVALLLSPAALALSYPLVNMAGLLLLICIIISVVGLHLEKVYVDPFFSIGIGFLILGFVIFILNNLSVLPNSFLTENSSKIGSGLEVIFLSLSMTNLIRRLKSDKEQSQTVALRKSQEMNDIKSHFMSNMSHELRTPLNAIMGIADEMMKEKHLSEMLRSNFEVVKYASVSLLSSVNDILDFSKIEKGKLRLDVEAFNPLERLEEISQNWKVQASEKGLFYVFETDPNIPRLCKGDAARLGQIANNILGNAIKFTLRGNVTFQVSARAVDKSQVVLILKVTDTGVGIPQEKMDTIFESFSQESIDDKRNFGGLGLGLSIVKKLVDLHYGKIELIRREEGGTECVVELPYENIPEDPVKAHGFNTEENDLRGANLLVVEDNALNQLIMRKILSGWKNTPFSIVENGKEAITALEKDKFDLILMDLQMPIMDGYETSQYIRAGRVANTSPDLPIIAVTADTMEETKEKVFSTGINDYVSKPFRSEDLFEKVAVLLTEKGS